MNISKLLAELGKSFRDVAISLPGIDKQSIEFAYYKLMDQVNINPFRLVSSVINEASGSKRVLCQECTVYLLKSSIQNPGP